MVRIHDFCVRPMLPGLMPLQREEIMASHNTLLQIGLDRTKERLHSLSPEFLSSLPPLRRPGKWQSWGPLGVVGVFYQTMDGKRLSEKFKKKGFDPYPGLLTTDPKVPVAINISSELGFFASNRIEGRAFRVQPTTSFVLWQHAQVFRERLGKHVVYGVPLAFILGVKPDETETEFKERLDQLIDHSVKVWCDLEPRAKNGI